MPFRRGGSLCMNLKTILYAIQGGERGGGGLCVWCEQHEKYNNVCKNYIFLKNIYTNQLRLVDEKKRPIPKELPNQQILQTRHRNAAAKTAPWTPNATKVANGLVAQTCQFDKPCTDLAWCSFPKQTTLWTGPLK